MEQNNRNRAFSDYERNLAIALISKRVTVLDGKKTDNVSLRMKKLEWEKVASEFNSSDNVEKSVSQSGALQGVYGYATPAFRATIVSFLLLP